MKRFILLAGLGLIVALTGCSNRYKMTLTNGTVLTTRSKPRLDKVNGVFNFKNAEGRPESVPVFKVREYEPL